MAIPLLDLDGLAKACVEGDLDAFAAAASQLGWTMTEQARAALLHAVANTNFHHWYSFGVNAFTVAQAIGLMAEAASNASGIAITEQVRKLGLGKEIAIAFRDEKQIHFGVRYASNLPMNVGNLWPELKPWFKVLERNRARLETWAKQAEGVVSVPLARRASEPASGEELLAAVIADPDDVERRLVYADYLVAQGDAQGELIQLCERGRDHANVELQDRIAQLEKAFGERIAGEVAQLASAYTLQRGFVTRIEMAAPSFAKHGDRLLDSHPIERLDLKPVNDKALARLAKAAPLRRIRTLYLSQIIGRTRAMSFDELCRSPYFDALRRIEIWTWESGGKPQEAFAELRAPQLESMFLYEVDSAPQILAGLARNETVRMRDLEVSHRRYVDWPVDLQTPAFAELERLSIQTGGDGVGRMLAKTTLPALTSLQLGDRVPIDTLQCPNLRRLSIGYSEADSLVAMIARHPKLDGVRIWDVDGDEVNRLLAGVLALPAEHPLAAFELPTHEADPELVERVRQRFMRNFYDPQE